MSSVEKHSHVADATYKARVNTTRRNHYEISTFTLAHHFALKSQLTHHNKLAIYSILLLVEKKQSATRQTIKYLDLPTRALNKRHEGETKESQVGASCDKHREGKL